MKSVFQKSLSFLLSVLLVAEPIPSVVYANESTNIVKEDSYKNLYALSKNDEDHIVVETKIIDDFSGLYSSRQEKLYAKKIVDKKYFGCGNLIDYDEGVTRGTEGAILAACDIIYDVTNGWFFGEELLRYKTQKHTKTYLEYVVTDTNEYSKPEDKSFNDLSTETREITQNTKYNVTNNAIKVFRLDDDLYDEANHAELKAVINDNTLLVLDKSNEFTEIQKVCEQNLVRRFKNENKIINENKIVRKTVELDGLLETQNIDIIEKAINANNVSIKENRMLISSNVKIEDFPEFIEDGNNEDKLNLDKQLIVVGSQLEERDELNPDANAIKSEIIEQTKINASLAANDNKYGWNRNGYHVRSAEGKVDIFLLDNISINALMSKGGHITVDKGQFKDTAVRFTEEPETQKTINTGDFSDKEYLIRKTDTHKYVDQKTKKYLFRKSEQDFKYDYFTKKFETSAPQIDEIETIINAKRDVTEQTIYAEAFGYKGDEALGNYKKVEYIPVTEYQTITRSKTLKNYADILVTKWILGDKIYDKITALDTLKKPEIFDAQLQYMNSYPKATDIETYNEKVDEKTEEGTKFEGAEYIRGTTADWILVGGIGNLANKKLVGAEIELKDGVDAFLDAVDIVCIVTTGISVASAGRKAIQTIAKHGMKKFIASRGIKIMGRKAIGVFAKKKVLKDAVIATGKGVAKVGVDVGKDVVIDMAAQSLITAAGHPELAPVVKLRRIRYLKFAPTKLVGMVGKRTGVLHIPKNYWTGKRGNSFYKPPENIVPQKSNPNNLTIAQIFKKYNINQGVKFTNGKPDFRNLAQAKVKIKYFTSNRRINFMQFDRKMAEQLNKKKYLGRSDWQASEINDKYLKPNGLMRHENPNTKYIEAVPSIIHDNVPHTGGVSVMKTQHFFKDKINVFVFKITEFVY